MKSIEIKIGKYSLENEIGSGGFGIVYKGTDTTTNKLVALKIEGKNALKPSKVKNEYDIYSTLSRGRGFPKIHDIIETTDHSMMVMEYLGPSLGHLFAVCKKRFSLKSVLMIFDQLISRLEYVHSKGYVYRDIKPGNFVLPNDIGEGKVYMIDFGLAKKYINDENYHIPYEKQNFAGTAQFAPLNAHLNKTQSRRDDLESLGYMMIYFLRGTLPWNHIQSLSKKERKKIIGNIKLTIEIDELCTNCPREFQEYFKYVKSLGFTEKPNYKSLRQLFRKLSKKINIKYDFDYCWINNLQNRPFVFPEKPPRIEFIATKHLVNKKC